MAIEGNPLHLAGAGLSIIPIRVDGSKAPVIPRWRSYQERIADVGQLERWFSNSSPRGLAAICGRVSGGLEVIDIDAPDALVPWVRLVGEQDGEGLIERLVMVETPSGGFHFLYRCLEGVGSNTKLAQRKNGNEQLETLIETRGEGGYVILPGSPAECHPAKKPYRLLNGELTEIPEITPQDRALLLECARAFDEIEPSKVIRGPASTAGNRPGDDFNRRVSWDEILEPHGWKKVGQRGDVALWRRPGKTTGISATTNFGNCDLLYNFSTNGHPFDSDTGYTKFAAHTLLNHDGDFSAAAVDLAANGYGFKSNDDPFFASFASFALPEEESWPEPSAEEAFYGLAGDFVHAIESQTEADPAALLTQFLVAFGNCVGRGPHFLVEADRHYTNLFEVIVGNTSRGRKGTSWGHIQRLFEAVDSKWAQDRVQDGLSSGEGLIWAVRDPIESLEPIKENGRVTGYLEVIADRGIADKRLLVQQGEFSGVLRVLNRDGNTLSPVMRNAWDTGTLNTLVKNSPAKATGAHISVIGHITKQELLRYLDDIEAANGFGNRFLWVCSRRSKLLPEGGKLDAVKLDPVIERLRQAVTFAWTVREMKFNDEARKIWREVYPELSKDRPGLLGALTARAEAQVIRLSCIYALLDCSAEISPEHLKAGLAAWNYCLASCRYIFGAFLGDPVADELLRALRNQPDGMTRTEINNLFRRHKNANQIARALAALEAGGLAKRTSRETEGRSAEVWLAVEIAKKANYAK